MKPILLPNTIWQNIWFSLKIIPFYYRKLSTLWLRGSHFELGAQHFTKTNIHKQTLITNNKILWTLWVFRILPFRTPLHKSCHNLHGKCIKLPKVCNNLPKVSKSCLNLPKLAKTWHNLQKVYICCHNFLKWPKNAKS